MELAVPYGLHQRRALGSRHVEVLVDHDSVRDQDDLSFAAPGPQLDHHQRQILGEGFQGRPVPGESTAAFAFDPERFAAHKKFFVEDVRRWVQSRFDVALPADRTAVVGVSAGGELALAMGLRHPDIYGAVFCASPGGGYRPPAVMPSSLPRAYLVASMQEPFFLQNATRWADALRDAGADVVMTERIGSHGDAFWREEFPLMVAWAFGR